MGDSHAPSSPESTAQILQAMTAYFPGLMKVYNEQVGPQAQTQLDVAKAISPEYQALMNSLYATYGKEAAQTGSEIDAQTRRNTAQADVDILKNQGRDISKIYQEIDREANPEYYAARAQAGDKLAQLLGSINLDNASPEAERLINQENIRSGNINTPSATNTVTNALSFGKELDNRRQSLSQAIGQATAFMQGSSNASFNPATTILNKPTSNSGQGTFQGVRDPSDQAYTSGQGLLNNVSSFQNNAMNINANRRDVLDRVNETMSSL